MYPRKYSLASGKKPSVIARTPFFPGRTILASVELIKDPRQRPVDDFGLPRGGQESGMGVR